MSDSDCDNDFRYELVVPHSSLFTQVLQARTRLQTEPTYNYEMLLESKLTFSLYLMRCLFEPNACMSLRRLRLSKARRCQFKAALYSAG